MISVRAALDTVLASVARVGPEQISIAQACGRVLARAVVANRTVPPFDNCAMDGFAVRAADVAAATPTAPVRLRLLETVPAGSVARHAVVPGTAVQVMTGSAVPAGADAVVRVEDTQVADGWVAVLRAPRRGEHIRRAGEDLRDGEVVWPAGRLLRPADIGVLASLGMPSITVFRRPRVSVLATGNELVSLGEPIEGRKLANSNAYALAAAVREAGGEARLLGIVPDDLESSLRPFEAALECSDVVLSTGGVSMGNFDLVRQVLARLGAQELFWKVRQKPGKPLSFGTRGRTLVFALPGNPVSALVCFYLYVRPALLSASGAKQIFSPVVEGEAEEPIEGSEGLTDFVRCQLRVHEGRFSLRSAGSQSSGVLRSLSLADALAILPESCTQVEAGTAIRALWLAAPPVQEPPF